MRRILFIALSIILPFSAHAGIPKDGKHLLIRSDDMGSFHSANLACIESYQNGITCSVEIMACCPWFIDAVCMLNAPQNKGLDVGIHIMLTSEWEGVKWRPLTDAPSLVDGDGYFHPIIWKNSDRPGEALVENTWDIVEIEKEFRAQIELVKKYIPRASHVSGHMGAYSWNPEIREVIDRLAAEYGLYVDGADDSLKGFPFRNDKNYSSRERVRQFISAMGHLEEGVYLFVEHPSYDSEEMRGVGHKGYYDVAKDRQGILDLLVSPKVRKALKKNGITLINYTDL